MRTHLSPYAALIAALLLLLPSCVSKLEDVLPLRRSASAGTDNRGDSGTEASTPPDTGSHTNLCADKKKNGKETDVDCGGLDCKPCELERSCARNSDCLSEVCAGSCVPAACANEKQDGAETDNDCGGPCAACGPGQRCNVDSDCSEGGCGVDKRCGNVDCSDTTEGALAHCGETSACGPCGDGQACEKPADCESNTCISNSCRPSHCTNNKKDEAETDVDCGGDCGAQCNVGQTCQENDDCAERACLTSSTGARVCHPGTCRNNSLDGDETDVDCGGGCGLCPDGNACSQHSDCQSNSCSETCQKATCDDARLNQDEADVDCGGGCQPCEPGAACAEASDCGSDRCEEERCRANAADEACLAPGECRSLLCDMTCQLGGTQSYCEADDDCLGGACSAENRCEPSALDGPCRDHADCETQTCLSGACQPGEIGAPCSEATDCASSHCVQGACADLDLAVTSDGVDESDLLLVHFRIARGAVAVNWEELAVLFFFTPEVRTNLGTVYESDPDSSQLCVDLGNDQWAYVWRNSKTGPVLTSLTYYYSQVNDASWAPMVNANDFSYVADEGANPNIGICRLVNGHWRHVQGNIPPMVVDPCSQVEPDCSMVTCDDPGE